MLKDQSRAVATSGLLDFILATMTHLMLRGYCFPCKKSRSRSPNHACSGSLLAYFRILSNNKLGQFHKMILFEILCDRAI
jgi:hypothetical protein